MKMLMGYQAPAFLAGSAMLVLVASFPSSAQACTSGFFARGLCLLNPSAAQGLDRAHAQLGNPLDKAARVGVIAGAAIVGGPVGAGLAAAGISAADGSPIKEALGNGLAYGLGYGLVKGAIIHGMENVEHIQVP